jgi:Tfp pilus assembly protein PilF
MGSNEGRYLAGMYCKCAALAGAWNWRNFAGFARWPSWFEGEEGEFLSAILKLVQSSDGISNPFPETPSVEHSSPGRPFAEHASALSEFLSKRGVIEVLVCLVTFLAYLPTLTFGFVYDDKPVIVDNPIIRSWHFLGDYFTPHIAGAAQSSGTFYRPVTVLWFRLNLLIFGLDPGGWHFAMLALHVLMTYLVFVLAARLTLSRGIAGIAAVVFGLHPVHVENVAWLSSVNDLLMAVLLMASLLAFINSDSNPNSKPNSNSDFREGNSSAGTRRLWMAGSLLFFLLALLSKETAAVFPLVILCFAASFSRPQQSMESTSVLSAAKAGLVSIPYFIVLLAYLGARRLMLRELVQPITPLSWTTMALTWPSVLWFDVKHLLLPITSSEFYPLSYVTTPEAWNFLFPLLMVASVLAGVAFWIARRSSSNDNRDVAVSIFAIALAVLTILPTLYLRAIAPDNFVHDRFLYFPSVGVVILLALGVEQINAWRVRGSGTAVKRVLVAALCVAGFAGTFRHQLQWANNVSLYEHALNFVPQNMIVQDNLANEFVEKGRYDRAVPLYLNVLQRDPRFWPANYNLGYAYYRSGKFPEAAEYLNRAVQIDDRDPDEFIYLARVQMERGQLPQAALSAERALQLSPLSPGFHFILGKIFEASGERARAVAEYQAELRNHPENSMVGSELQRLRTSK